MRRRERWELFRLAMRERSDPEPYYTKLAEATIRELPVDISAGRVLDLGCGHGYDAAELVRSGAQVVAMDLDAEGVTAARARDVACCRADAASAPFPDGSFDGVYCSNLVEHVPSFETLLDEIARLLRSGGWAWISWTNWFSPWGGHNMIPFHLLGPRWGPRLYTRLFGPPPKNVYGEGLFAAHVGNSMRVLDAHPDLERVAAMPRYYRSQRWILKVPVLREFLTWNCVFVVRRR